MDAIELPDSIRVPLHELRADTNWLLHRAKLDPDAIPLLSESMRDRCSQIETATFALLAENTRLREASGQSLEALEPFADLGVWMFASKRPDDAPVFTFSRLNASDGVLTRGHFKAAHLAAQGLRDLQASTPMSSEEPGTGDTTSPVAHPQPDTKKGTE